MKEHSEEGALLESYLRALENGEAPDREALLARHPGLADALDGLDLVHRGAKRLGDPEALPGKALGDYRIVREIGRGGMAVVYEAEQTSLGRRVALKVLPFAAVLDAKQLQRFKNEALAAAHLQHPHIVPVHAVGCERGVHYYAMQYVEGQSLAAAIRSMKGGGTGEGTRTPISSHGSNRERAYIQMAAALGMQAAEALDHAHQLGVVHRDIKPANLLVDQAGTLWVTDFGLARSLNDVGLTMTGELLGTVRYMSPEQALAKRVPVDHRTDVYSLGATLYELFTLEPAFPGDDPHRVIQDIAFREPAPPRRLNPSIPRDVETVILKAMWKDPAGRYATAQEMARDLERCINDQPVLARRPSLVARAARWSRRHRGLVAASFVVLLSAIAILLADNFRVARALGTAETNLGLARDAVDKFLVEAGIGNLADGPLPQPSRRQLLEAALRFHENYTNDTASLHSRASILHALHRYEQMLPVLDRLAAVLPDDPMVDATRGHVLMHLGRSEEALAILDRAVAAHPTSAHAHWCRGKALLELRRPAEALAAFDRALGGQLYVHAARGHALHDLGRFEEALAAHDLALASEPYKSEAHTGRGNALHALGRSEEALGAYDRAIMIEPGYAGNHSSAGDALHSLGRFEEALAAHDRAIALDPAEPFAHLSRAATLRSLGRPDDARAAVERAIALAPGNASTRHDAGLELQAQGDSDGAIREYREAIRIDPGHAKAHCNLGVRLAAKGDRKAAIEEYRTAIRLRPDLAQAYHNLGAALFDEGNADEAIEAWREAIRVRPEYAKAYDSLGCGLRAVGRLEEAIEYHRVALRLDPHSASAHYNLGFALMSRNDTDGAIGEFREAIRLQPALAEAQSAVGVALLRKGDANGAVRAFRDAILIRPEFASAHANLGNALLATGDFEAAADACREAIRLQRDFAEALRDLGRALMRQGRFQEGLPHVREAHEIGSKRPGWATRRSKELLDNAERLAQVERLIEKGEAPRPARERVDFAWVLQAKARHAEAAKMWADAFAEDATLAADLGKNLRYDAACCAARAAAGTGADAAGWRARALEWLRADLAAREERPDLAATLDHWKRDADLAAVRDRLDAIPAREREQWTKLWADVDALLARAPR